MVSSHSISSVSQISCHVEVVDFVVSYVLSHWGSKMGFLSGREGSVVCSLFFRPSVNPIFSFLHSHTNTRTHKHNLSNRYRSTRKSARSQFDGTRTIQMGEGLGSTIKASRYGQHGMLAVSSTTHDNGVW